MQLMISKRMVALIVVNAIMVVQFVIAKDKNIYSRVSTLRGQVFLLNHPTLGKTEDSGDLILFQRVDCSGCIIGVRTDIDGKYRIDLGLGKYRVHVRTGTGLDGKEYELFAPGQEQYIEIKYSCKDVFFDINIMLPPNRQ